MQRELLAALKSKTLLEQDLYQMQLEGKQRQKKRQQVGPNIFHKYGETLSLCLSWLMSA